MWKSPAFASSLHFPGLAHSVANPMQNADREPGRQQQQKAPSTEGPHCFSHKRVIPGKQQLSSALHILYFSLNWHYAGNLSGRPWELKGRLPPLNKQSPIKAQLSPFLPLVAMSDRKAQKGEVLLV